jgi:ketosteroid isomerase-like protein
MSQQNVEIAVRVTPAAEVDCVPLFRDDDRWTVFAEGVAPLYDPDVVCFFHEFGGHTRYVGLDGARAFMLDWMAPWSSFRIDIERVVDLGDRVLVLCTNRGQREDSTEEVRGRVAVVWTMRDATVIGIDAYTTWSDALEATGLST